MLSDSLLAQMQKPARYIGSEFNSICKDPENIALRAVLCYPDVYEVGMCHVGLQILYNIANQLSDVWCERAFYPHLDAVKLMTESGALLYGLESGTPLHEFDVVGITLQHEMTYTTILALLELGGIPLESVERGDEHPIVLAGGPCAYNPEPLADFFDAFVIGDGEEAFVAVLEAVKATRDKPRNARLQALAALSGVYVPLVHDPLKDKIVRCILDNLDTAAYPKRPIVAYAEVVHDRAQLEVARGCTRGCRFCQAGMIYRPVRERSVTTLREQAQAIIANTGFDEISLVSLNCPDYTGISQLIDHLHEDLSEQRVSVGLPSLRIDTFSVELARKVQRVRKSGLTFAPEAGSQRLRDAINKGVTEEDLLTTVKAAFAAGWQTIKLYFMIGLPTETDEDVLAIADLVKAVAKAGRETMGPRASRMKLNVSVSNFVPKAHTPLQWDGQLPLDEFRRRQNLLRSVMRDKQVTLSCHDAEQSCVESTLARGGRQTGKAILAAYKAGAVLDAWKENFNYQRWVEAFTAVGLELETEAMRAFSLEEALPWSHIDCGVRDEFLKAERERVLTEDLTADCRFGVCAGCGISALTECQIGGKGEVDGR